MRFADELVDPTTSTRPSRPGRRPSRRSRWRASSSTSLHDRLRPRRATRTSYRERVLDLIEAKAEGKEPSSSPETRPPEGADDLRRRSRRAWAGSALMPRSLWTGSLSFGLVNVPVALYSAVRDLDLHFRQLHEKDGAPIEVQPLLLGGGRGGPVRRRSRHGYELDDGRQVIVSPTTSSPRSRRARRARSTSRRSSISPRSTRSTSTTRTSLVPAGDADGAARAYRLLVEVMARTDRAALGPLRAAHQGVPGAHARARRAARADDDAVRTTRCARPRGSTPGGEQAGEEAARPGGGADRGAVGADWDPERYEDRLPQAPAGRAAAQEEGQTIEVPDQATGSPSRSRT